jgi:hypothetical protein
LPVVGWTDFRPDFRHHDEEVLFIIEADLARFFDGSMIRIKPFEIRGEILNIRYFDFNGHVIWGATAMMLNELLSIIERADIPLSDQRCE